MIWTAENYRLYLRSEHWADTRRGALRAADFRCARCGATRSRTRTLDVHHRTYERLGSEQPGDLEVLCRDCHETQHGIVRTRGGDQVTGTFEHISRIIPRALAKMGFAIVRGED